VITFIYIYCIICYSDVYIIVQGGPAGLFRNGKLLERDWELEECDMRGKKKKELLIIRMSYTLGGKGTLTLSTLSI